MKIFKIPQNEYGSFVIYGGNPLKVGYLKLNMFPCYKYHIIQDRHAGFSEQVKEEIRLEFESCIARWILVDSNQNLIDDILINNYELLDSVDEYQLYKLDD